MTGQITDWIQISLNLFSQSNARIIWNLFLALIPLSLSFYLFRPSALRNVAWWAIFIVFIAFLPNAPYILTDSIHIWELSAKYPLWSVILVLLPQYTLFIAVGFQAYVISLMNLDDYLVQQSAKQFKLPTNIVIHALCAVGIYLGRFERFNSWDFVTQPKRVLLTIGTDLLDVEKFLGIAIAFFLVWLTSELTKLTNSKIKMLL